MKNHVRVERKVVSKEFNTKFDARFFASSTDTIKLEEKITESGEIKYVVYYKTFGKTI